jgi:hypothetical protein
MSLGALWAFESGADGRGPIANTTAYPGWEVVRR